MSETERIEGGASLRFIGTVESTGETSVIKIFPGYSGGLEGVDEYSDLMVLYWMHLLDNERDRSRLTSSRPKHGGTGYRGVFASHSPHRPNPIGVTTVELVAVEGYKLRVRGLDAFEGSPILDIKSA